MADPTRLEDAHASAWSEGRGGEATRTLLQCTHGKECLAVGRGADGTVRLWDTASGACLHTLRSKWRYERLDITGLTGGAFIVAVWVLLAIWALFALRDLLD